MNESPELAALWRLDGAADLGKDIPEDHGGYGRDARHMTKVYRLAEARRQPRQIFFDRKELNQLLSLYSRRVASGEWRDYAIDQRGGSAVFSVFRHSQDAPLFRIAKRSGPGPRGRYVVSSGQETLKQAATMSEALSIFRGNLRLVP